MRIIIITDSNSRSGGVRQAAYQADGLAQRGHDVTLCLPQDSSMWEVDKTSPNPLWYRLPANQGAYRAVVESLLPADPCTPTVIHGFHNKTIKRLAWWGLFWRQRNLACVAHRGVIFRPGNPLPYWSPAIKAFLVNSRACAKAISCYCPPRKIFLVPNGVPDARITPHQNPQELRKRLGLPDTGFNFVYVGNNNPVKGTDTLFEAFAQANLAGAKLITLGISPEKWTSLAQKLGIEKNILYIGYTENVADYLQFGDAFIFPSRDMDSSPNTLMEAIRIGLPTISTNVGGAPDIAGDSGILVPANNPRQMAQAMRIMAGDDARRATWAANSRRLGKRYSVEARCEVLEKIYTSLLLSKC